MVNFVFIHLLLALAPLILAANPTTTGGTSLTEPSLQLRPHGVIIEEVHADHGHPNFIEKRSFNGRPDINEGTSNNHPHSNQGTSHHAKKTSTSPEKHANQHITSSGPASSRNLADHPNAHSYPVKSQGRANPPSAKAIGISLPSSSRQEELNERLKNARAAGIKDARSQSLEDYSNLRRLGWVNPKAETHYKYRDWADNHPAVEPQLEQEFQQARKKHVENLHKLGYRYRGYGDAANMFKDNTNTVRNYKGSLSPLTEKTFREEAQKSSDALKPIREQRNKQIKDQVSAEHKQYWDARDKQIAYDRQGENSQPQKVQQQQYEQQHSGLPWALDLSFGSKNQRPEWQQKQGQQYQPQQQYGSNQQLGWQQPYQPYSQLQYRQQNPRPQYQQSPRVTYYWN